GRLTKLHLVGPADEKYDKRSARLIEQLPRPETVMLHGFLPASEVSPLLAQTQFGLTSATPENWSKSATFMAYAAHGCVIIGNLKSEMPPLNLAIAPDQLSVVSEADLSERTIGLQRWYRENASWVSIAEQIERLFARRAEATKIR